MLGKPGGVFFLTADKVPTDDAVLLAAAARAVLGGGRGSLAEQIDHRAAAPPAPAAAIHSDVRSRQSLSRSAPDRLTGLRFWNGFGGFTA